MDVLRAIITQYVTEDLHFQFDQQKSAQPLMGLKNTDNKTVMDMVADGDVIALVTTPTIIRKYLSKNKDRLPTKQVTLSLRKLADFKLEGIFKVRSEGKVLDVNINSNLFQLEKCIAKNRRAEYLIIFAPELGRLFMHNIQSGNLIWVSDNQYSSLSVGAKNVLYVFGK
jgi:hypothetical protein